MSLRSLCISVGLAAAVGLTGCGGSGTAPLPARGFSSAPQHNRFPSGTFRGWFQPGVNAAHAGYNRAETTIGTQNVGSLTQGWSFPTGAGILTPVLTDGSTAYVASGDGYIYAIDIASGAQKWRFQTYYYGETGSWIAISGSKIYAAPCFPDGNSDQAGVCALNANTGRLKWTWYGTCNCRPEPAIATGPVISGSSLIFAYRSGGAYGKDYVVALDSSTGASLWQVVGGSGNPSGSVDPSPPAISGGSIYIGTDEGLCSLQLSSGSLNWCDGPSDYGYSPAVAKGVVYTTTDQYGFYAFDATTGTQIWQYSPPTGYFGGEDPPAIAGRRVYFASTQGGPLYALDATTGRLIFTAGGDGQGTKSLSSASVANGVVYYACYTGLCAYDAKTGAALLAIGPAGTHPAPAIANGEVFNACASGPYDPAYDVCMYTLPAPRR